MKVCKKDEQKFEDTFKFCPLCGEELSPVSKEEQLLETIEDLKQRLEKLENKEVTIKTKTRQGKLSDDYKIEISKKMAKYVRDNGQIMPFSNCFLGVTGRHPGGDDYSIKHILGNEYGIKVIGEGKFERCFVMPSSLAPKLNTDDFKKIKKIKTYNWTKEGHEKKLKILKELSKIRQTIHQDHPDWNLQQIGKESSRIYKARQAIIEMSGKNDILKTEQQEVLHI